MAIAQEVWYTSSCDIRSDRFVGHIKEVQNAIPPKR